MDPLKTRDRKKHFTCFKPVTFDYDPEYNAALPNSFQYECHQRTKNRQSYAAALKSVLVKSFLGRKLQRKKLRKDSSRSQNDLSSKNDKVDNTIKKISSHTKYLDNGEHLMTNTNCSATTSTRSSIYSDSVRVKGSTSLDYKEIVNSTNTVFKRDRTIGMFVFMIGLFALVFGGKCFAILICTSTCLFVAPRWSTRNG